MSVQLTMMNRNDLNFIKAFTEKRFEAVEEYFLLASNGAKRHYMTTDAFNQFHSVSSPEMVKFYISSGFDVNIKNFETDETPLLTVIKLNESPDVVKELAKHGASIEARNKHTLNTPLNQAMLIPECSPETVKILLECGANVHTANKSCDTPLHNACRGFRGDLKIVDLLLKFGSPVNFRNLKGDTPLNLSLQNPFCTLELVKILLKFNAKVTTKIFEEAVRIQHEDYLNIISELIQSACITSAEQWLDILERVFKLTKNEYNLLECGKLIFKYSFLQCDDFHALFVQNIRKIKKSAFYHQSAVNRLSSCAYLYKPKVRSKRMRDVWSSFVSTFDNLKSFCDDCFKEIRGMKTDMLENNVSVYEFIKLKNNKFPLDGKIFKLLKETRYPIYADTILNKIKRTAVLNKLFSQQVYTIVQQGDVTRRIMLDVLSVCNIAKYLNACEIKNFANAFCSPSEHESYFWDHLAVIEDNLAKERWTGRSAIKKKISPIIIHSSSKIQKKASPRI